MMNKKPAMKTASGKAMGYKDGGMVKGKMHMMPGGKKMKDSDMKKSPAMKKAK
tara:strand:+ start:2238 stop:2396 length:159 start_codon:yes stop_codon:yes gene_type:complete